MSKRDINPVMCSILKVVEYKVQIITFHKKFHDFYTHLSGQLCKMPKSFNGQRYRCDFLKTTSLCTFVANKSPGSTEAVFLHFVIVSPQ